MKYLDSMRFILEQHPLQRKAHFLDKNRLHSLLNGF